MARNREKANLMFNRWTSMKEDMLSGAPQKERRPFLASEVKALPEAERWRRDVIRDISKKVAEIQNAGLGEPRIRDLNDEINKLLREKGHWERQIRALGGAHHPAPVLFGEGDAVEVAGSGGYRYFGAAKDLPGVRELLAGASGDRRARTRGEILRGITPDYYGYRDEEDGELVAAEAAAQAQISAAAADVIGKGEGAPPVEDDSDDPDLPISAAGQLAGAGASSVATDAPVYGLRAQVPLPEATDLEAALVAKKKQLLLARFAAGAQGGTA